MNWKMILIVVVWTVMVAVVTSIAWAGDVTVHRGSQGDLARQHVYGVQVVRGMSNYPVYEIRESAVPPLVNPSQEWFRAYEAWRRARINCRINPDGRGRRGC